MTIPEGFARDPRFAYPCRVGDLHLAFLEPGLRLLWEDEQIEYTKGIVWKFAGLGSDGKVSIKEVNGGCVSAVAVLAPDCDVIPILSEPPPVAGKKWHLRHDCVHVPSRALAEPAVPGFFWVAESIDPAPEKPAEDWTIRTPGSRPPLPASLAAGTSKPIDLAVQQDTEIAALKADLAAAKRGLIVTLAHQEDIAQKEREIEGWKARADHNVWMQEALKLKAENEALARENLRLRRAAALPGHEDDADLRSLLGAKITLEDCAGNREEHTVIGITGITKERNS